MCILIFNEKISKCYFHFFQKKIHIDPFILGIGTGRPVKIFINLLAGGRKKEGLITGRANNNQEIMLVSSSIK